MSGKYYVIFTGAQTRTSGVIQKQWFMGSIGLSSSYLSVVAPC